MLHSRTVVRIDTIASGANRSCSVRTAFNQRSVGVPSPPTSIIRQAIFGLIALASAGISSAADQGAAMAQEVTLGGGVPSICNGKEVAAAIASGEQRLRNVNAAQDGASLSTVSALVREFERQGAHLPEECHTYVTRVLIGRLRTTTDRSALPFCGLLGSGDAVLMQAALDLLGFDTEANARDECVVQELERLAHGSVLDPGIRIHAVVLLRAMKRGQGVASVLEEFAVQDAHPDLAEEASLMLVQDALAKEAGLAAVRRLSASAYGVLRDVAAVALAEEGDRSALKKAAAIAKRSDRSPSLRGRALEAVVLDAPRTRMTRGLLREMLREENWFGGVPGVDGPEHSLMGVLSGIEDVGPVLFRGGLIELAGNLERVPEEYRLAVKGSLDNILIGLARDSEK